MIKQNLYSHSIIAYDFFINIKYKKDLMSFNPSDINYYDLKNSLLSFNEIIKKGVSSKYGKKTIASENEVLFNKLDNGVDFIVLSPDVGYFGQSFKAQNIFTGKKVKHNKDTAALYLRRIFVFLTHDRCIFVFHRAGLSGSKTIFSEAYNNFLSNENLHCYFDLIMTDKTFEDNDNISVNKLILETEGNEKKSSDSADNISKSRKSIKKEVVIHLDSPDFNPIKKLINWYKNKKITKEQLFQKLKDESNEVFDNAKLNIKIGKNYRKINLDQLYGLLGDYDITDQLDYDETGNPTRESIISSVKDYALEIIKGD